MSFNNLYNQLLQKIITLGREYRHKMLTSTFCDYLNINYFLNFLSSLKNSKAADLICKFICRGEITDIDDERINKVISILKRNTSFDIQQDISLELFLKENKTYSDRDEATNIQYLDSIPQFSLKEELENGVVIYRVLLSEEGQKAVRNIIDKQFGYTSNPWCLTAGHGKLLESSLVHWNNYIAFPKHIAFLNGKLIAFCADSDGHCTWWDRNDASSKYLILTNGSRIKTRLYEWKDELKKLVLIRKYKLRFNPATKRYDSDRGITIYNSFLIDGYLPIPFGRIDGDFWCSGCTELKDLTNGPTRVLKIFSISYCSNLKNLISAPEYVGGDFTCNECIRLLTLEGAPNFVGGCFVCSRCHNLVNLKGAPRLVNINFICNECLNLRSLLGGPDHIGRVMCPSMCPNLLVTKKDKAKWNFEKDAKYYVEE